MIHVQVVADGPPDPSGFGTAGGRAIIRRYQLIEAHKDPAGLSNSMLLWRVCCF